MMTGDYWERIAAFLNDYLRAAGLPDDMVVQADPAEVKAELAGFVRASGISVVSLRLMLLRYDVILHEEDIPPDLRGPENRKMKRRQMRT